MSQKYKSLTGIELIKGFCSEVLAYGIRKGLSTEGVKIWMVPRVAQSLELGEFLSVEVEDRIYDIPIIEGTFIRETPLGGGKFQSDIFVGNPDWSIEVAEGELWFEQEGEV